MFSISIANACSFYVEMKLSYLYAVILNPLSVNPTKWLNTLKQSFGTDDEFFWVRLTFLWDWRLKG